MPFDSAPAINSPTIERLRYSRYLIDRAWCQGRARAPGGAVCIIGAISGWDDRVILLAYIQRALRTRLGDGVHPANWQDAPERTKREVLELFNEAIGIAVEDVLAGLG